MYVKDFILSENSVAIVTDLGEVFVCPMSNKPTPVRESSTVSKGLSVVTVLIFDFSDALCCFGLLEIFILFEYLYFMTYGILINGAAMDFDMIQVFRM